MHYASTPLTYLTTQEVAGMLNCHAATIINRVHRGHISPAAKAGRFSRGLLLWTEDQLPAIRQAIVANSATNWRLRCVARHGGV
jgi:hypothetical protein